MVTGVVEFARLRSGGATEDERNAYDKGVETVCVGVNGLRTDAGVPRRDAVPRSDGVCGRAMLWRVRCPM